MLLTSRGVCAMRYVMAFALLVALVLVGATAAFATEYARMEEPPYVTGPVIHESDLYAPYTETAEEYAPYTAGPVIHPSDLSAPYTDTGAEYAPYTAGPVIHPSDLLAPYTEPTGGVERVGNYLVR